jgi:DNA-directed RNA polymerase specialized sigma24 family protein
MSDDPQIAGSGDASDQSAVGAMLGDHREHLLEYCTKLLGDSGAAASVTEAALVAAQAVLLDPDKLRAWLFALARADVNSYRGLEPDSYGRVRHHVPTDQGDVASDENEVITESLNSDEIASAKAHSSNATSAASADMSGSKREVLDLVYEHGIRRDDLSTVLGLSGRSAWDLLEAAEAEINCDRSEADHSAIKDPRSDNEQDPDVIVEQITGTQPGMLLSSVQPGGLEAIFGEPREPNGSGAWESSNAEWAELASIEGQPGLERDESQLYATGKPRRWRTHKRGWAAATLMLSAAAAVAGVLYLVAPSLYHARDTAQPKVTSSQETGSPSGSARHSVSPTHSHLMARHHRSKLITHRVPSGVQQSLPIQSTKPAPTRSSLHPSPSPTIRYSQPAPSPSRSGSSPSSTSSPTPSGSPDPTA